MEQMEKRMITADCPFCQSSIMVEAMDDETPEQLAASAAMVCRCQGAVDYRRTQKIREMLVNDLQNRDAVNGVTDLVNLIKNEKLDKATVKFEKITYSISKNAEGIVKFKRTVSDKEEMVI